MGGLFGGGGQKISTSAPLISSMRMQTSSYGRAIPLLYGKTRVASNVIWFGDFKSIEHRSTQSAGGKGGGGGTTMESISYTYQTAVLLGLCEGPVMGVTNAWVGKKSGSIGNWNLSQFTGSYDQQPMPYLATYHAGEALSYRGTAYVGTGLFDLSDDATLPNMTFEVDSSFGFSAEIRDANPADVVRDYCSNLYYGAGVPASKFGDLTAFSDFCVANSLFVSPAYTEQEAAHEAMSRLFKLTNSGVYYSDGKIKAVPYSDLAATGNGVTFTPNLTPVYDLTDDDFLTDEGADPIECSRVATSDAYNCIRVKFFNRASGYNEEIAEAKDQASIEQFGLRVQEVELHEIVDAGVARFVAQLILQRTLYVRNTYEFRLGWKYALLEPTDLVTLTDAALGLDKAPVRITEIEEDEDGDLTVRAEEVPIGSVGATKYPTQTGSGYTVNYNAPPGPANTPVIFEPPLALASAPEIWVAMSGGANWGGCDVWVSDDDATYLRIGRITGKSRHGILSAALASGSGVDTINTAKVDLSVSGGALLSATQQNALDLVTLCYVDGELMAYRDATLTAPNQYDLGYLVRGAYGTTIGSHAAGTKVARLDQTLAKFSYDKARVGKTVYLKFQSFNIYGGGIEDLATLTPVTYQITGAPLADVTGLALEQPFTGRSCKIKWNAVDAAAGYTVEVWAGSAQTLRRTVSVGDARRYEYSWEDATADGGPWRQLTFRVRATSQTGASGNWATLVASNPVPAALTGVTVSAGFNSVFFSCSTPADPDFAGVRIWLSTASGFTPGDSNLVYDGPDCFSTLYKLANGTALAAGTTYYLKAAGYDSFGKTGLNISSEVAVTPVSVAGSIKPGEIEAAMVKAVEATKVVGTLQDWQLAGIQAGKLLGKIAADQFAGQFGSGNLAQNSSFELNGGAPYGPYNNAGMTVATSQVTGRTGGKALRIDFTGTPNNSQQGILGPALKDGWLPNTTYVLSIYARAGGGHLGRCMVPRWNFPPATTTSLLNPPLSDNWQRYAWRITWNGAVEPSYFHLTSDEGGAARNGWFEFDDLQVEQGDVLTQYNAFSQRIEKTEADTAGNTARITNEETARNNGDAALTIQFNSLSSTMAANQAQADNRYAALVSTDSANAQSINNVNARLAPGGDINNAINGKAAQASLDAAVQRISSAETTLAGKANSQDITALTARVGTAEASVTQVQQAQATLDGKVASKWGVVLGATTPDGRQTLSGIQAFNDGRTSQFVITTSQLLVVPESLIPDPYFNDTGWWGGNLWDNAGWYAENAYPGSVPSVMGVERCITLPAGTSNRKHVWSAPVKFSGQGQKLRLIARGWNPSNDTIFVTVRFTAQDGRYLADLSLVFPPRSGCKTLSAQGEAPAGTSCFRVIVYNASGVTTDTYCGISAVKLDLATSADMIVDGAITTDKVAANAITADKIAANQISATHIIAGSLTGDRLAANTITADKIQAGTITANEIAADAITATKIAAGAVDASKISTSSLSAITANLGTITAGLAQNAAGTNYMNLSATGTQSFIKVGSAVDIKADGSGVFARTIVSAPDVKASGTASVNSGWLGGSGSWTTFINTGVSLPGDWTTAASDMYQASATIAGGLSQSGGANGYATVDVVYGDGLLSGAANNPIDNQMYIKFTWNGAGTSGGRIQITSVAWKLVRV